MHRHISYSSSFLKKKFVTFKLKYNLHTVFQVYSIRIQHFCTLLSADHSTLYLLYLLHLPFQPPPLWQPPVFSVFVYFFVFFSFLSYRSCIHSKDKIHENGFTLQICITTVFKESLIYKDYSLMLQIKEKILFTKLLLNKNNFSISSKNME